MSAYFTIYGMREIVHCLNQGEEESCREILKQLQECREYYESVDVLELTPEQVREFELNLSTSELTGILTKWRRMDKVYERRFSESVHEDFKDERVDLQFTDWKKL